MSELREAIENIIKRCDYSNNQIEPIDNPVSAIIDAVMEALPKARDNPKDPDYTNGMRTYYSMVKSILQEAKENK